MDTSAIYFLPRTMINENCGRILARASKGQRAKRNEKEGSPRLINIRSYHFALCAWPFRLGGHALHPRRRDVHRRLSRRHSELDRRGRHVADLSAADLVRT